MCAKVREELPGLLEKSTLWLNPYVFIILYFIERQGRQTGEGGVEDERLMRPHGAYHRRRGQLLLIPPFVYSCTFCFGVRLARAYLLPEGPPLLGRVLQHPLLAAGHAAQPRPALPHGGHGAADGGLAGVAAHQLQLGRLLLQTAQLLLEAAHQGHQRLEQEEEEEGRRQTRVPDLLAVLHYGY